MARSGDLDFSAGAIAIKRTILGEEPLGNAANQGQLDSGSQDADLERGDR